jgi:hypothetical protein
MEAAGSSKTVVTCYMVTDEWQKLCKGGEVKRIYSSGVSEATMSHSNTKPAATLELDCLLFITALKDMDSSIPPTYTNYFLFMHHHMVSGSTSSCHGVYSAITQGTTTETFTAEWHLLGCYAIWLL